MRKNFGAKPYTYPQPAFIIATYGGDGTPDAMNAATRRREELLRRTRRRREKAAFLIFY